VYLLVNGTTHDERSNRSKSIQDKQKKSRKEEWVRARTRCKVGGVREREEKKMER
jgi:hypothetical protein